ncbi:uncharacterized protein K460DRAFT_393064 [Cucurbitaria berberidis CBS 394.84]|uniref:F-box domain-containing protein n=1 Tax=Cucurbitaria berberidis CBS 394.84 TaxID=1168544 RepID=A0A9P4GK77_9PLEO|nr:uncharacterized protein K460DRAFT_393064 [Cucurbitaria berberidis CBS 394.84]KAF1847818.1 hypothetical protein K460DRAFT_393064 [Cucurbitaria berberidis CBS 394.84]
MIMRRQRISRLLHLWSPARQQQTTHECEGHKEEVLDKSTLSHEDAALTQAQSDSVQHRTTVSDLPVEILQHIFSSLDFRTLFTCRRVCHIWNTCIPGHSPQLQETLFLPSARTPPRNLPGVSLSFVIHCRDTKRARAYYVNHVERVCCQGLEICGTDDQKVLLNPFVQGIEQYLSARLPNVNRREHLLSFKYVALQDKRGGLWLPRNVACLRNAFLTTPPITSLSIHLSYKVWGTLVTPLGNRTRISLSDRNGVKFVHLFDWFEREIARLLREKTLRMIDNAPGHASCSQLYEFRNKIVGEEFVV